MPTSAVKQKKDISLPEFNSDQIPTVEPEKNLFSWQTVSRPFKKRGREYWVTLVSISSLLAFILFLAEGVMPVILIVSLIFLYYILSTVQPEEVQYKITNKGIKIADKTTPWSQLLRYWFINRLDSDMLVFETNVFPFRLELVVEQKDIPQIKSALKTYISEVEFNPTYLDKAVDWVVKKLPNS